MPRPRGPQHQTAIPDAPLPEDATAEQLQAHEAYRLFAKGSTFMEIAGALKVNETQAIEICFGEAKRRIDMLKFGKAIYGPDMVQFHIDRLMEYLNWALTRMNPQIERGSATALAQALKTVEMQAKLLDLIKPEQRMDVTVTTDSPAKARELMKDFFGGSRKVAIDEATAETGSGDRGTKDGLH